MGKKKIKLVSTIKFVSVAALLACSTKFAISSFSSTIISDKRIEDVNEKVIEDEQKVTVEEINDQIVEEVPVEEEKEVISSELLDSGYQFQTVDFNTLKSINNDACAWITIDDTNIDFPILQGEDNDYYLHHDIDGNESVSAAIFVDARNESLENKTSDLSDLSIIYGHHMKNGKMFANLMKFKDQEFVNNHPFGVIYTPDGYAYKAEFVAGRVIDGEDDSILYKEDFEDEDTFNSFIKDIKDNSITKTDVDVNYEDKMIALVTCSYETDNSRFVLYAKLTKQYTNELQMEESIENTNTLNK